MLMDVRLPVNQGNPALAAQMQQQQLLRQQQQRQAMLSAGMYGGMNPQNMPMGMPMNQMNAAQFAAMRSGNMRPVGVPPHLQQQHLAQQLQQGGGNPQQAQVSDYSFLRYFQLFPSWVSYVVSVL